MDRALPLFLGGAALLAAAMTIAVASSPHAWGAWYVLLLFALAAVAGGLMIVSLIGARREGPRLVIGEPYVEARGIMRKPVVTPTGEYMGGTVTASFAASATGPYVPDPIVDTYATTHIEPGEEWAFFVYVLVRNRPLRGDVDARNVHATIRYFDRDGDMLIELHGRWAGQPQHGDDERTLEGEERTIPSNGNARHLDVACKYLDDDECFAFNDENRFRAPNDLRYRPLGPGPVRVEVTLHGSNAEATASFELSHNGAGSRPQLSAIRDARPPRWKL